MSDSNIVGILKDVSQFIVGTIVSESDKDIVIKDAVILGISAQGGQINVNFIPLDMLSLQPPIGVRNMVVDPTADIPFNFKKDAVLSIQRNLSPNVIENYKGFVNKSPIITPNKQIVTPGLPQPNKPEETIIKLF